MSSNEEQPNRRPIVPIALTAVVASVLTYVAKDHYDSATQPSPANESMRTSEPLAANPSGNGYVSVPVAPPYHYKSLDEYKGKDRPSSNLVKLVSDAALQLIIMNPNEKTEYQCSASYFNGYVVTAGHCLADAKSNATITIEDSNSQPIGTMGAFAFYDTENSLDIGMGAPKLPLNHTELIQTNLLDTEPQAGEVFTSTQFPGGTRQSGQLIFLEAASHDQDQQQVLVTDPLNGNQTNQALCEPGASGSLIVSDYSIGVLDTGGAINHSDADRSYGITLPAAPNTRNCGMTVLKASIYKDLITTINTQK